MTFYTTLPLIAFVLNLALFVIVIWKAQPSRQNRIFSLYLLSMALWGFFIWRMRLSPNLEQALMWEHFVLATMPGVSIFLYRFSVLFKATPSKGYRAWAGFFQYTIIGIFAAITLSTNLIVEGMQQMSYGYAPVLGPLFNPFVIILYGFTIWGAVNIFRAARSAPSLYKRNQAAYIAIGTLFAMIGTVTDVLPTIGVPVYPLGIVGNVLFALLATFALVKYQLLDIKIVIRKGLSYALMSSIVAVPYVTMIVLLGRLFTETIPTWIYVVLLLVLAICLQPLWKWSQGIVDRLFYRERYDYLKALGQFTQQIKSVTELDSLASSTIELISNALQVRNACLMMPSLQTRDFTVVAYRGLGNYALQQKLSSESPFIRWMEQHSNSLQDSDLNIIPQLQALSLSETEILHELRGELYVPLSVRGRLVGILILGPKLSQQLFTAEDLQLLSAISSQLATSLENARLFQLEKQRASELAMLQQSSARITTELDTNLLLQKVVEEAAGLLRADAAAFFAAEDNSPSMVLQAATGLNPKHSEQIKVTLDNIIPPELMNSFRNGDALAISDVKTNPIGKLEFLAVEDIRSALEIPILKSGQLLGMTAIFSKHRTRWFTEEEINLVQTFTHHASSAIENAYLYGIERKQRMELEQLDEMKSEFMVAISHELKTPLTSIRSAGELILDESGLDQNSHQGKLFGIINRNVKRLERRTQELLDFAKLQSAILKLEPKAEDINRAIEDTVSLSLPSIWSRKQTLETKLPESATIVMLDRPRFEQIMFNLLSNANKYSPQGGEISVETRVEGSKIIISVSDRGPGVPPEDRKQIFDAYFRGENSSSGLGIGLNIAKSLVELHGGQIWVSERDGGGSVFSFSLPIVSTHQVKLPVSQSQSKIGGTLQF